MKKLHPHANKLLAYADNALSADEREEVEKILANDESAVAFLEQLKISDLPYKEFFDHLLDDKKVEKTETKKKYLIQEPQTVQATLAPQTTIAKWLWPTSLVASLLLGATLTFFIINANTENHDNWIVQVADYHLLYIRETVSHSHSTAKEIKKLSHDLGAQLDAPLFIPDLNAQSLDFRRGQILNSNGRKLVQLAYLPKNGLPVALCILKNNVTDSLPKTGESRGLPYVTWSKNGLSYVIIGAIDKNDLNAAALSALSQMDNNS